MSGNGPKPTCQPTRRMSIIEGKADIAAGVRQVRFLAQPTTLISSVIFGISVFCVAVTVALVVSMTARAGVAQVKPNMPAPTAINFQRYPVAIAS